MCKLVSDFSTGLPDSILVNAMDQGLLMLRVHGEGARSCGQPASLVE